MVLSTARSAFLLAGIILLTSSVGDVASVKRASVSGQGSTVIEHRDEVPTLKEGWHFAALERTQRGVAGEITLGALFIILGLGLHMFVVRRNTAERPVKVHQAIGKRPVRDAKSPHKHWILWMNVRM
ncbi:MAG: hypothetical protein PHE68_02000 [Candidatus Peribacteraceae bacterium]|nr:hypothetical protein [Candidatus Peribacteraceae bacterium]MDD5074462.1 hypothetical protein [Candidatus Peribacteraceae bacterium]